MSGFHDGLLKISIILAISCFSSCTQKCSFHSRNDPFSHDILPIAVPPLLHEMPATDRQQLLEE